MIIWPVLRHKILKNQTTANLLLRQQKSRVLSSPQDANSKLFPMCPSQGLHCDLDFHCSHSTLLRLLPVSPKVLFKETFYIFTYTSSLGLEHFLHQSNQPLCMVKVYLYFRFQLYVSLSQILLWPTPGIGVLLDTPTVHIY